MPALHTLLTFFGASLVLALAPGPDNVFVLAQSAATGRRSGLLVTAGLCTGLSVHTLLVAVGVAALIRSSPPAFSLLKGVGAAYLLYLAWMSFRAPVADRELGAAAALDGPELYRRGIVMNITNPKVSLFFLAFLPQFADPTLGPLWPQIVILGAVFILATVIVFGGIAVLAARVGAVFSRSERAQRMLNRGAALVFVILALNLAFARL